MHLIFIHGKTTCLVGKTLWREKKYILKPYTVIIFAFTVFHANICKREVFLEPWVEVCFQKLKMAATSEEFTTYGFDIQTSLPSSILSAEDMLHLEKKKPQPKGRKITLVSDNKISSFWVLNTIRVLLQVIKGLKQDLNLGDTLYWPDSGI